MRMPTWDLFCRVIDNHGDVGVCWRLAADLATRGVAVRLWIDDAAALAWMAPAGCKGVEVRAWPADDDALAGVEPAEVVIEAFGCELPSAFLGRMATRATPPVWIDLEYLSAEDYVERSHGLASPQAFGPGAGLAKWFFYPGFTARAGGLIREADLVERQAGFDRRAWLIRRLGIDPAPGERIVSLFCYDQPALPALVQALADLPTLVLAASGPAARQWPARTPASVRAIPVPLLSQTDYDHLLWSCDLNVVRGEDSFVRAQWAGAPFVWQAYPQQDGAHRPKLEAFLRRHLDAANALDAADAGTAGSIARLFRAWNGIGSVEAVLPTLESWREVCGAWRDRLLAQTDLTTRLLDFAERNRVK